MRHIQHQKSAHALLLDVNSSSALVEYLVTRSPIEAEARAQLNPLVHKYGFAEVHRMLARISQRLSQSADAQQAEKALYAEYMHLYQRFGGARPFLDPVAFRRLNTERAGLIGRELLEGQSLTQGEQQQLRELTDLLLAEAYLWDDLCRSSPLLRWHNQLRVEQLPANWAGTSHVGVGAAGNISIVTGNSHDDYRKTLR